MEKKLLKEFFNNIPQMQNAWCDEYENGINIKCEMPSANKLFLEINEAIIIIISYNKLTEVWQISAPDIIHYLEDNESEILEFCNVNNKKSTTSATLFADFDSCSVGLKINASNITLKSLELYVKDAVTASINVKKALNKIAKH